MEADPVGDQESPLWYGDIYVTWLHISKGLSEGREMIWTVL